MLDYGLAIGHHLLIFALFGVLVAEIVLFARTVSPEAIRLTATIDGWYGILAGVLVVVGFVRAIFAAKGWAYYAHNGFFWAKIATFVAIALLSVIPTLRYLRWRKTGVPEATELVVVRRLLWAEVLLFALLPIFAAAMARGYGEFAR